MKDVLILIPAFNEEDNISVLLDRLKTPDITGFADILVVNDASADRTSLILRGDSNLTVISHIFNLGYGSALQIGYKYAVRRRYKFVIQLDADGQHDVVNVSNIYQKLITPDSQGNTPDIVIGSRFEAGSQSFYLSGIKKVAIGFFRKVIKWATGQTILDPTSGLQGLSRRAFLYYSMYQNFDLTYPDANMIIQMLLLGFRVVEIPSVMHARQAGVSMHSGIIKPLLYMMILPLSILSVILRIRSGRQKRLSY